MRFNPASKRIVLPALLGVFVVLSVYIARHFTATAPHALSTESGSTRLKSASETPFSISSPVRIRPKTITSAVPTDWENNWMRLVSEPDTPQRTAEMTKALEQLASSDPADALTIAMQESDAKLREALLQGVLRGWGSLDPSAAADWARSEDTIDHGLAMASVMNGAAKHPDQAIQLTASLSQRDPAQIQSYGQYLVFALTRVGDFSAAADFAVKGAPDIRPNWVVMAYYNWAVKQQDVAVAAALKLTDPSAQLTAFRAAISGWAQSNPKALVETAENFPEGQDRKFALTAGLRSWIEQDPAAAADWISHHKYTPEMDAALEE